MKIERKHITVRELVAGYQNNEEDGVLGYGGLLDIRPPFQREFVYNDKQQKAVVDTVQRGLPLNVMYWAVVTGEDGEPRYEVLDGQQRTISVAQYVASKFTDDRTNYFHNLTAEEKEAVLDYELLVYVCEGTDRQKLEWFERINIAGEKLTAQELRNAVYAGPWLAAAKKFFSRTNGPAHQLAADLLAGTAIRQDFLETALKWICDRDGLRKVEDYMAAHQHDANADDLVMYFRQVESWVRAKFPPAHYRKQMDGLPWGELYNRHGQRTDLDAAALEVRVAELMVDDEVGSKKGIYAYVLTGDAKTLNLRSFTESQKTTMFERQHGLCARPDITGHDPKTVFTREQMEADHVTPWVEGGKTELSNGQMLCKDCNRRKSSN